VGVALVVAATVPASRLAAQASQRLTFISVSLDAATRQADRRLTDYLYEKVGLRLTPEDLEYEQVIRRLVDWRREDGLFVARTTPYAYVVAELLGARLEPLATYVSSATNRTTYRSYFVVNRRSFPAQPELPDVLRFLTQRQTRARFVYQSQFSTSSFFLPSLFFRSHRIFQMPESTETLTAIAADRLAEASSAALVEIVGRGEADIAAVWDGVKARFEREPDHAAAGRQVWFVPLPTAIPNDLLICAAGLDPAIKSQLRQSIAAMTPDQIAIGDFRTWQNINEATDTRVALSSLRQAARQAVAPVPVEIQAAVDEARASGFEPLVEAARQALRQSETEFVQFDADFHRQPDVRWTLEPIHDGAVTLRSAIPGYGVDEQSFQLSFRSPEDLTARIVAIIQSRLHRIRYVWPFSTGAPIVIRDSAFALPVGSPVKAQRVTWIDPERNQFRAGQVFDTRIATASFSRYEFPQDDFARQADGARLDPLSNTAYRVILMRPAEPRLLFRALTVALVVCFVLAGVFAGWTLVGLARAPAAVASEP
jgi:ABC-type phosphate/phosphonate transport system substrate-binding protein